MAAPFAQPSFSSTLLGRYAIRELGRRSALTSAAGTVALYTSPDHAVTQVTSILINAENCASAPTVFVAHNIDGSYSTGDDLFTIVMNDAAAEDDPSHFCFTCLINMKGGDILFVDTSVNGVNIFAYGVEMSD